MIETRKPDPEPGWAPSLWPKAMTIERICLEARLNSWAYLSLAILACLACIAAGAFFVWQSLYTSHPWRPIQGILIGTLSVFFFSLISLFAIAIMITKVISGTRKRISPDYGKLDRLLPMRSKDRSHE